MKPFIDYTDEQLERLINSVYNGQVTPERLPDDLYKAITERLTRGVVKGFGASLTDPNLSAADGDLLRHFTHNAAIFSAAKTHKQVEEMSRALFGEDGQKRPFSAFRSDANEVFDKYNKHWLKAEYNTAISQAQSGRRWNKIQADKALFPIGVYRTVGDGRVSDEHKQWDGIRLPWDDPFWLTHYPPNRFNCRCDVDQEEEGEGELTTLTAEQKVEPPELFAMNAGADKVIFKPDHPYFKVSQRYEVLKANDFDLPVPPDPSKPLAAPKVKRAAGAVQVRTLEETKAALISIDRSEIDNLIAERSATYQEYKKTANDYLSGKITIEERRAVWAKYQSFDGLIEAKQTELSYKYGEILGSGTKADINFVYNKAAGAKEAKAAEMFASIIGDKHAINGKTVNVKVSRRKDFRAYQERDSIFVSDKDSVATIAHELGHALEEFDVDYFKKVTAFYEMRTAGQVERTLRSLTGIQKYKLSERAIPDGFVSPYWGKVYKRNDGTRYGTEITSMWFTEVLTNPAAFIAKDPETFDFIFNLLRNVGR